MSRKSFEKWKAGVEADPAFRTELAILDVAAEIDAALARSGLSRAELARRLGTSRAYVTKILRGNANFTLDSLVRISDALGGELRLRIVPRGTTRSWTEVSRPVASAEVGRAVARGRGSRAKRPASTERSESSSSATTRGHAVRTTPSAPEAARPRAEFKRRPRRGTDRRA